MKKILTLLFAVATLFTAQAQLPNGSIAPDFTLTDINGNTWHLYELLDQGKSVVLDFSATWCGPCWNYHNSGALETLYNDYGPNGTGEYMVFMIEADPTTNIDCISNAPGCNSTTQGDWTAGTPYPIIDADDVPNWYEVGYYPTIYHICSNRLLTEAGQIPAASIYALHSDCAVASGVNNAALLEYQGFSGFFCGTKTFTPSVKLQNLGTAPMTSAVAEIWLNGTLTQTINWTGNLGTYGLDVITFDELSLSANTDIEIKINQVNGVTDDAPDNNLISKSATLAIESTQNVLTLELRTDNYPKETYWEILNSDGKLLYAGGNAALVGGDPSEAYTGGATVYTTQVPMPGDGCFEFVIYDAYGDGICCGEGNGSYKLIDPSGNVLLQGASFEDVEHKPFSISNAVAPVKDNGAIIGYLGDSGNFCGTLNYAPALTLQNLGSNAITSMELEISANGTVIGTTNWTGNIASVESKLIDLDPVTLNSSADLVISIKSVNGNADGLSYKNSYSVSLAKNYTEEFALNMSFQLDQYAYEVYWQLMNSAGDVLYSGGNELVGPNGGGARIAAPGDPGAYANNQLVEESFVLPDNKNDCYSLLLVDDYGDGLADGNGGFIKIIDINGATVLDNDLSAERYSETQKLLDVNPLASGVKDLNAVSNVALFPNPTSGKINLSFNLLKNMPLQISVFNGLGELVMEMPDKDFNAGANLLKLDVSNMTNGLYFIKMSNGAQQLNQKFTVLR